MCLIVLHEIASHLTSHTVDMGHFVPESYTIKFVRMLQQLWPERRRDELRIVTLLVDHVGDSFAMLGVQSLFTEMFHTIVTRL